MTALRHAIRAYDKGQLSPAALSAQLRAAERFLAHHGSGLDAVIADGFRSYGSQARSRLAKVAAAGDKARVTQAVLSRLSATIRAYDAGQASKAMLKRALAEADGHRSAAKLHIDPQQEAGFRSYGAQARARLDNPRLPETKTVVMTARPHSTSLEMRGEGVKGPAFEIGGKSGQRFGGMGVKAEKSPAFEVSAGFATQVGKVEWAGTVSRSYGQGTVSAGNANSNIFRRIGNGLEELKRNTIGRVVSSREDKFSVKADANVFSGGKVKLGSKGAEVTAVAAEINVRGQVSGDFKVKTGLGAVTVSTSGDGKSALGLGGFSQGSTTIPLAPGIYAKRPSVNATRASVKVQPCAPENTKPFSDLRADGHDHTSRHSRFVQGLFIPSATGQITFRVPDDLRRPSGRSSPLPTYYRVGREGRTSAQANLLDKGLAGQFVRVRDLAAYYRQLAGENGPRYAALATLNDKRIVALNRDKVTTLKVDRVPMLMISKENIRTGLLFDPAGRLRAADVVR